MKTIHRSRAAGWLAGLTAFALAWLLSACSMLYVEGDVKQVRACERLALLEAALVPPMIPPIPLIDAALFKDNIKPAIPEIAALHEAESRTLADRIGAELKNGQPQKMLYGTRLYGTKAYRSLSIDVPTYSVILPHKYRYTRYTFDWMARIFLAEGSLHFLDLNFSARYGAMYQGTVFEAARVAADRLGVDCTAVASADLRYQPGIFGINGYVSLWVTVWYFDRDGRQIAWAVSESESVSAPAEDPSNARKSFEQLEKTTAALAKQVYHGTQQ